MIRKYRFGSPFDTEAVVIPMESAEGSLPYFQIGFANTTNAALSVDQSILNNLTADELAKLAQAGQKPCLCYQLDKNDVIYGLGQNIRGINKRGWTYTSYATDDPSHTEFVRKLYGAHNFFIIDGRDRFGVFIDHPGEVEFDMGYADMNKICITPVSMDMDVYIIEGDSLKDIVHQFRTLVGRSYIAPRWALGYGQSRWGYDCAADIRRVCRMHRENNIPLDMIYVDIDYMDGYRNFTVDDKAYPNFPAFVEEMQSQNIHLIPIIDAGCKAESGYFVDDEGVEKGYFVKEADGSEFVGVVWPGEVHFPDFLNPDARRWFGDKYKILMDQGIDGFWNDMNEPAIFYSPKGCRKLLEKTAHKIVSGEMTDAELSGMSWSIGDLKNSREDYRSMHHNVNGKMVCHDDVHNLYGYNMTRAAGEAFERLSPDKRILLFSRSSYTGMHRYGGIWTGDNQSIWSHLRMNLTMLPGLNMQGFVYSGADLGGFGCDTTEDLLMRWLELGIFTPLMRNHTAKGTREQEVYQFTNLPAFRRIIGLRYFLLPYLYSEYMKACLSGEMLFRPLSFDYENDSHASQVEDQLMLGDSVMIAPVLTQNATGRYVYLPEEMKLLRLRSATDFDEEILPKGHHYVPCQLDEALLFIRPDKLIPVSRGGENEQEVDFEHVDTIGFVKTGASYRYYCDDGVSTDYDLEKNTRLITQNA
jgi:alpha-glucosidase